MKFEFNRGQEKKYLLFDQPEVKSVNSIQLELEEFASSIKNNSSIRVSVSDGYAALKLAHDILAEINRNRQLYEAAAF